MITIEHLYRQYESINSALSTMHTVLLQFTSTSEVDKIVSPFARSTEEISKLYFLADNLAKQQSNLIHKNSLLKQQLSALEVKGCSPNIMVVSLAYASGEENLRLDCDYTKDIQGLYRQIEMVQNAVVDMTIAINISTLYLTGNEISAHIWSISRELLSLFFMIGDFVKQQNSLTQEHDSLKKRLADLGQNSYNNHNIQVSSLPITRERENPLLDFDSPEAKQIFSGLSVPPLLLSSNAPSSSSSASASPRASLTKDCSQEIFSQSFSHSSSYPSHSPLNLYSTSLIQLEANEDNCRKKSKHIENEQKKLKRTKKHYKLLSLI